MKDYGIQRNDIMVDELVIDAYWDNRRYDCISGAVDFSLKEFSESIIADARRTARFWKADFTEGIPQNGDRVNIDGTVYRILDTHDFEPFIKFALGDEYAGK